MLTESMQKWLNLICMMQTILSQQYHSKTLTNEREINRNVDKTFSFSEKTIILLYFRNKKIKRKCVNMADINAL